MLSTASGITRTAAAWLPEGDYILRFTAESRVNAQVSDIHYTLETDGMSDDQDPDSTDPTDDPLYDPYYYYDDPAVTYEYPEPPPDYSYGYDYYYYYYMP